jgi:O-antigen ligase
MSHAASGPVRRKSGRTISLPVRRLVPPLVVTALLGVLIPLGTQGTFGAAAALGIAGLLVVLVTVGIEKTAVAILLCAFVTSPMDNLRPSAAVSFVTFSDLLFFVGIGTLIPILLVSRFQRQAPMLIGVFGVFTMGLVTSVACTNPAGSFNGLARLVVGALVMPVVFMLWRPGRRVLYSFAAAYVLGNCISVAYSVITRTVSVDGRYAGLTQHPNVFGLVELLALGLLPYLWFNTHKAYRWGLLVAGAVCGYGVWISGSRAALLVTVAIVPLYVLLSRSIEHALLLFGAGIVPLYLVGKAFTSPDVGSGSALERLRGGGSATASDKAREILLDKVISQFTAHPILGDGFGSAAEAHNIYLQVAAAGGIIGLVFYLLVLFSAIRQPLVLGSGYVLLALPAMAYALIGPLTPLIWDRYIWCVLALPFLVPRSDEPDRESGIARWDSRALSH